MKKYFNLLSLIIFFAACSNETNRDYYCETDVINFNVEGGTEETKVFSDYSLYVVASPSWIDVTPHEGKGTFTINVIAGKNTTGTDLNGKITFGSIEGDISSALFYITINQKAK